MSVFVKIIDYYFEIDSGLYKHIIDSYWRKFLVIDKKETERKAGRVYLVELKAFNLDIKTSMPLLEESLRVFCVDKNIYLANIQYTKAYVLQKNGEICKKFLCYFFYTCNVKHKILQFHSSLIAMRNYGLMFLGPSGIGKTTQAELWNKYLNALIINGDVVFIQETSSAFLGWGTPWHGSSPYCENTNVPVHAMIVLKQSPENSIRELTGFEKVTAVSQSVFYPRWLENGMELCLETLDHLLTKVPVYELSCRPDEDAVRLTEETIFGKSVI